MFETKKTITQAITLNGTPYIYIFNGNTIMKYEPIRDIVTVCASFLPYSIEEGCFSYPSENNQNSQKQQMMMKYRMELQKLENDILKYEEMHSKLYESGYSAYGNGGYPDLIEKAKEKIEIIKDLLTIGSM